MIKRTLWNWLHLSSGNRSSGGRRAKSLRPIKCYRTALDALEDRRLLSVSTSGDESALIAEPLEDAPAQVLDRHVFYNNSHFDNDDAALGTSDDAAIAADKQALLPGQKATFANYTSYDAGINGVMIDVAGLAGVPTLADFVFRVGNSNSPDNWIDAPAPTGFDVRVGGGTNGATRITFSWADGSIRNEWLQVVVRATDNTGLADHDIFYFGNAVGETGDHPLDAYTTTADRLAVRANPRGLSNPADATSPYDFNRDGLVNSSDEMIALRAYNGQGGLLWLITPDAGAVPDMTDAQDIADQPAPVENVPAFVDFVSADVTGRWVFYNNSQFDGTDPAANAGDDFAIADKTALRPGNAATHANYTNYSRGINGIMIDIAGLPGEPTVDDFEFRVGPTGDPNTWDAAPEPMSITVRSMAGAEGADRITIIWADNSIEDTWLQVTVKATPVTGLKTPDVFYFGNLMGDAGGNFAMALVTAGDIIATRNSPYSIGNPAPINEPTDFDRDSLVNEADELIARNHAGLPNFRMIAAPEFVETAEAVQPPADFVHWGDAGYRSAYAPTLVTTPDGTILYFSEGRYATKNDASSYAVVMRRSFDGGVSWTPLSTVYEEPLNTDVGVPTAVVDETSGEIFLFFTIDNTSVLMMSSDDSGATWTTAVDITANIKVTAEGNPNSDAFPDAPWSWYAVGTGHGIQIQNGPHAGRMLISALHRIADDPNAWSYAHVIYSDDHGLTWHLGGGLDQTNPVNARSNENTLAEGTDGSIYMSIRHNGQEIRGSSRSFDGGMTWSNMQLVPALSTSPVQATLLRVDENTVLFAAPYSEDGMRQAMTLWVSNDNMFTWQRTKTVFYGYSSYSDMVMAGNDTVLLVFNGGRDSFDWVEHVYLVRFNLRFLESADDYQFTWNFNEKAPGETVELGGNTIIDTSLWDNRGIALANTPQQAPTYVAGPDGRTALSLTAGSDRVILTQPRTRSLQFKSDESFTVEAVLRSTASSGMILGVRDTVPGWSLKLSNGDLKLTVADGTVTSSITSSVAINDGNWHHVSAVRDAVTRELFLYVDGVEVASGDDATTESLWSDDQVVLGADGNNIQQLAFDIDLLRVSRRALPADERIQASHVEPPRYPDPVYAENAPNTIDGLELWLPAYDHKHYFADSKFADPLPNVPSTSSAIHSAIDASANEFRVKTISDTAQVIYADDPGVGPNWRYEGSSTSKGNPQVVQNSSGASPFSVNDFDFVQNSGEFTISTFVKPGQFFGSQMTLLDNTLGTGGSNGFMLAIKSDGSIRFYVIANGSTSRINETTPAGIAPTDEWYHLVVVGNGPGQPVSYYATPVSESTVAAPYQAGATMSGANSDSPSTRDLTIGAQASGIGLVFNGQMVDQAIYDRALTPAEIQQLFDYTKQD